MRAFVLRFQERTTSARRLSGLSGPANGKDLLDILAGTHTVTELRAEGPDTDPGERDFLTFKGRWAASPTGVQVAENTSANGSAALRCGTETGTRVNAESPDSDAASSSYRLFKRSALTVRPLPLV